MDATGAIPVPPRLSQRVQALFGDVDAMGPLDAVALAAGVTRRLVASTGAPREVALDLLAVDAVVTRALERLALGGGPVESQCVEAMRLLALEDVV